MVQIKSILKKKFEQRMIKKQSKLFIISAYNFFQFLYRIFNRTTKTQYLNSALLQIVSNLNVYLVGKLCFCIV